MAEDKAQPQKPNNKATRSVSDMQGYVNPRDMQRRLQDIEGRTVTVHAVEFISMDFGLCAKMTISQVGMDEPFEISSGAAHIMQTMTQAEDENFFPFECRFVQRGRGWFVSD
jgi:hypothetical protein